jgi:hypothetical protein
MVTETDERIVAVAKLAEKDEPEEGADDELVDDVVDAELLTEDSDE